LNKTIIDLQNEIDKIQITKKQVEQTLIMKFKSSCVDKITKEKTQILDAIDQYNKKWLEYINTEKGNHKKYKSNLKSQLQIILKKIKELIQYKNDVFEKMKKELKNQKEEEIKKLKSQLSKSGLKESELRDAIAQAEKDANIKYSIILSAKEKEYSDVIDNLQFEKSSIEQLNTSLKNENETLKKEQELLKKNKGNLNEEYMSLKQESDNFKSERDNLKSERDNLKSESDKLKSEHDKLKSESDNLKSERDNLKSEHDNLKSERDNLKSERDNLKSEGDNLKSERDNLKSEGDNLKSEGDELRKNTGSLQKEYDELKSERDNLRSERENLRSEHDELTSEYTSLQSEQENLKNENQDLKKAHEELMNELKDLIKVKEEEMEKIRKNELKAQEELDKLKREFDDNLKEIELKIKKTFTDQMLEASERFKKDSDIKENQYNSQIELKNKQISELKDELEKVRKLLEENSKQTKVTLQIDTDSCFKIINNFAVVNNVFNRKLEIIGKLQNIIDKNTLEIEAKQLNILRNKFENVKNEIVKYIQFLDLEKYLNDPNMEYFKSKSTLNKISPDYCNELENLSIYWNENKDAFREQDHILTNIYEDLSGAVRVYIKIKPLLQNQTQAIQLKINDTNTRITVSDQNETKNYGDFYNIYEPEYTNVDMFTGNVTGIESKNLNVEVDTIDGSSHKALYNTFKQVQDGYSIVFFGYGVSGSGKTRVLLGDQNTPGIIHYGLSNLPNIKKISVKNIFEQYIYKFSPNTNNISGKIHHLYGFISELKTHSIDEVNDFLTFMVEKNFEGDLDNFNIKYITDMFNIIEKYRIQQHRIKKTPNNPVSSRSHLFITFEIEFTTGKVGHITMVDAAGREDPKYIFDVFIGNPKTSITSLLSAYGTDAKSVEAVEKYMRPELKNEYQPDQIFEILKESYYITETLNHLVYFFNTKNHIKTKIVTQKGGDKYSTSNYFVSPLSELKISDIKTYNNCLTLPIMEYLEFKNNKVVEFKPNKYVMIVCIRQDQMNTAFTSLDFAQSIKST
jgi:predicted  nucleic acid-binding Zn-ribbon protein